MANDSVPAKVGTSVHEMLCPACGSAGMRKFGVKNDHILQICGACGTVSTRTDAVSNKLNELYDHYYDAARFEMPVASRESLSQLARSFDAQRKTGNWLDVGFGEGGLLSIAQSRNWKCFGTEISPHALAYGTERGWIVTSDVRSDARFSTEMFDVVTMIEFLEHVTEPAAILASASSLLRPGGVLYLTTPNVSSINRRLLSTEWSIFSPPEHLTIWSVRGITRALRSAGLDVARVRTEGLNPKEMLDRFRPSRSGIEERSRNDVGFALNAAMTSSPLRRRIKHAVNEVLSLLRMGDSLKVWAVKA